MYGRLLSSGWIAIALAAAGCAVESSSNEPPPEAEEGQSTDELTSTPGSAIWTKVYRPASTSEQVIAGGVATDSNGDTFIARCRINNATNPSTFACDLSRYSPTGTLELRRAITPGRRINALAVGGGLMATLEGEGSTVPHDLVVYSAATGAERWRKALRNNGVFPEAVTVDSNGRVIVVGRMDGGGGTIDGRPIVDQNGREYQSGVVARWYSGGTFAWAQRYGAATDDETTYVNPRDVAVDGDGEIFVTGSFGKDVNFGGGRVLTNAEPWSEDGTATGHRIDDGFVLKLAPWGTTRWATQISGIAEQRPVRIGVTFGGRVGVAGNFRDEVVYPGGGAVEAANTQTELTAKAFFSKLDPAGGHVWSKTLEGTTTNSVVTVGSVMLDDGGRLVLAGSLRGTFTQGSTTYSSGGELFSDAFVGTFGATTGARIWLRTYGESGGDVVATDAALTSSGRIMLGGHFYGSVNFGLGTISHFNGSPQSSAGFLARLHE